MENLNDKMQVKRRPIIRGNDVYLWNLAEGCYMKLGEDGKEMFFFAKRERKRWFQNKNCKHLKKKQKEESDAFFGRLGISVRTQNLLDHMKATKDPRLAEIIEISRETRKQYLQGNDFSIFELEIVAGNAILNYVEGKYPDLYGHIQRACKWWDKGESV